MLRDRTSPRVLAIPVAAGLVAALTLALPATASGPSTVTQTYSYTGTTTTFRVPAGITQVTVTLVGGQGGRGGADSAGPSPAGGYQGLVTGTMSVTPGQVLTVAVGRGGATGTSNTHGSSVPANYTVGAAVGGVNPLGGYAGGNGGEAGFQGSSGNGGAGGAASVIATAGAWIVAGGSGGAGGSGQYAPTLGRVSSSTFSARTDTVATTGQQGVTVATVCNNAPQPGCDGGSGGGGGGGAVGGAQGTVQFGSGSSNEWYGYGGYPGQNSTAGISGLSAAYQYYAGDAGNGSASISYTTGPPAAPTAVSGEAQESAVALTWVAPVNTGGAALSDYLVQYAPASDPTNWTTVADQSSTTAQETITGLADGTAYVFQVAAVNSFGTGPFSTPSAPVTPTGPPGAPAITAVTPGDGTLSVAYSAASSGSPVLSYQYQLDGSGPWVAAPSTTSPLQIAGLVNGTAYAVQVRAVSAIGSGAASNAVSGTPAAPPGAPTITAVSASHGAAAVSFTPGYTGGSAVTDYEYQLGTGSWIPAGTTSSPLPVTGLADGTTYLIAIRAVTTSGPGAASQSTSITTPGLPAAPVVGPITAGDGSLSIPVTAGSNGGSTITAYQYQLTNGGNWVTVTPATSPIVVDGLTNGTTYAVSVLAVTAVGAGPGSAAQAATPATTAGAPVIIGNTVAGSDTRLSADFTPPASDGGAAITTYEYSTDAGATWRARDAGGTASPLVISTLSADGTTPLVNGTTYDVELRAMNAVGAGVASDVATGIAQTTPAAPTVTAVTPAPASLQVTIAPGSNGGAAITAEEYRLDAGPWVDTGTLGNTFLIAGLTNGTSYAVTVRAVNAQGDGAASTAGTGTPATTPAQPTIPGLSRADRALTVAVADATDGGSAITEWDYSTDGGTTWAATPQTSGTLTITTLSSDGSARIANGTSYPVAVRAVNAVGTSPPSGITVVGPSTVPSAPAVTLSSSNGAITATFAVTDDGGSPVSAIEYQLNGGSWADAGTLSSPFTIGSLTNGTAYSVQVRADNAIGAGAASTPASATPFTVPAAPTLVTAVSDTGQADVSWAAPGSTGGSAITGYIASAYVSTTATSPVAMCTTAASACAVTGLSNGTAYYLSVVAQNLAGSSVPSAPRVLVTPLVRPDAPTLSSLTAGNALLTLAFVAGSAGSSPITGYQFQLNGGGWLSTSSTTSPLSISGVANGTSYQVALRAVSAAGVGTSSSTLTAVPFTYPDAPDPTLVVAAATDSAVVVSWAAPNNHGSTITSYTATAFTDPTAGSQAATCATTGALTCTITGLTNGTPYYISLQAGNAAGLSTRSAPRVAATPSAGPGPVSAVTGISGDGQVALSWTAGTTGGAAISDYTIWYSSGGAYSQFNDGTSTATTATVTGLTNGTAYTFEVYAVNVNGPGAVSAPSAPVTPLAPGTVPTATPAVSVAGGFTFTISNYSVPTSYVLTATNGAVATQSGPAVTVANLAAGASSTVTVTASRAGYVTTSLPVTGAALPAGVTPTFTTVTRTPDGFTFQITNYLSQAVYTLTPTNGATVNQAGASVVVSGLGSGVSASVTVSAARTGYAPAAATASGMALALGAPPALSAPVGTADGFTFTITNYSAGLTYTIGATGAATTTRLGAAVTVSGLAPGAASTVTVTATDPGQSIASAQTTGIALLVGVVPVLSASTALAGGFSFAITNSSFGASYALSATSGSAALSGSTVTVSGLAAGATSTITVLVSRSGYLDASAQTTGSALLAGIAPTFSPPVSSAGGFTVDIANYDPGSSYALASTAGTVTGSGPHVTVAGLAAGMSATVTVVATRTGYVDASAQATGSALLAGPSPTFSPPLSTVDGFTFTITNFSFGASYALSATSGSAALSGSTITVTGLAAGATSMVTVLESQVGYVDASAATTGSALLAGIAPTFSPPVPTADGFTVAISNVSSGTSYALSATSGAAALTGPTITVTGLAPGATSTVTVLASRVGAVDASAQTTGSALLAGIAPTFSPPVPTADGFTFVIANYDPAVSYVSTVTGGAAVTRAAGQVAVVGLAAGTSATVTVEASRPGYDDSAATITGQATAVPVTPGPTPSSSTTRPAPTSTAAPAPAASRPATDSTAPRGASAQLAGAGPSPTAVPTLATPGQVVAVVLTAPPAADEQQPGRGAVRIDGTMVASALSSTSTRLVLSAGTLTLQLAAVVDGHEVGLSLARQLSVDRRGHVRLQVDGLQGGTLASVWGMSAPVLLTRVPIGPTHRGVAEFTLADSMRAGDHTLVVSGTAADGRHATLMVGIVIRGVPSVAPASSPGSAPSSSPPSFVASGVHTGGLSDWLWSLTAAGSAVVMGAIFLIAWRRRDQDQEPGSQAG